MKSAKYSKENELLPLIEDHKTEYNQHESETYGYFLIIVSSVFFQLMGLISKAAPQYLGVSIPNLIFLRGVVQLVLGVLSSFTLAKFQDFYRIPREVWILYLIRGFLGSAALLLMYVALSALPLGVCTSLFYLNPIFTILLSGIVLGERISGKEILGVLSNIIGVVLVTNPSLTQPLETPRSYVLGVCAILASSMIVSIELVILRGIGKRVHFIAHTLPFGVSAMIMGMLLGGSTNLKLTAGIVVAIIGCVLGFIGACFLNLGFQNCRASIGSMVRTVDVPIAYGFGLLLNEVPNSRSLTGSAMVIAGNIIVGIGSLEDSIQNSEKEEKENCLD